MLIFEGYLHLINFAQQQYSGSYPDLDAQRKLYFETGVPGFAPFTASLLDYNGFIRLIEYFDNRGLSFTAITSDKRVPSTFDNPNSMSLKSFCFQS